MLRVYTHVYVVAANQPQAEHKLERNAQPEEAEPRQHPAARTDPDAVVHQIRRNDERTKVHDKQHAEHLHREPDVRLEERRVQLRRVTTAQHVDHLCLHFPCGRDDGVVS